jgi:adenylate cyclase
MKQSLRRNLTLNLVGLLVGTVALLTIFALGRARVTVGELSSKIVRAAADDVNSRIANLTLRAERTAKLVAGYASPAASSAQPALGPGQFDEAAVWLIELMRAEPELSAVRVTLESSGEQVQVVQRPNGSLVAQTVRGTGKARFREDFVPFGSELRRTFRGPFDAADLREFAWYRDARATAGTVWSGSYLQRKTAGPDTPGVTCATPILARDGRLVGVASVDLTIGDISRYVQRTSVGERGYAFVLEFGAKGVVKVLGHPESNRLLITEGGTTRLADVAELADPVAAEAVRQLEADPGVLRSGETRILRVAAGRESYVAGASRVRSEGEIAPNWVACVVVPDSEYMAAVWKSGAAVMVIAVSAVFTGIGVALYVAQRVSRPLRALAAETERIRLFDLEPRPLPPSNIREIDALSTSVEEMKTGLRSFEKLVPAEYAQWLVRSGQEARLGGERRVVTTSFADLIGFTALSERLDPEDLVEVLAEHLDALSAEVLAAKGTIDKYNGDDVMSFWGAPTAMADHALLACTAALRGQAALERLRGKLESAGRPCLRGSFGIATGEVVVGNVGSRSRMNYTVIGDSVNLASRLQGLNRYYRTEILVSDETARQAGGAIVERTVDWVSLTGREEPFTVHELLGLTGEADPATVELARLHNEAMAHYAARRFDQALRLASECLRIRNGDRISERLASFAGRYAADPPGPDWDPSERVSAK